MRITSGTWHTLSHLLRPGASKSNLFGTFWPGPIRGQSDYREQTPIVLLLLDDIFQRSPEEIELRTQTLSPAASVEQ